MIVVDTNVVAYLYLDCEFTEHSEALLVEDSEWAAPTLWRSEFRNLLAGYMRRGTLTHAQALAVQIEAERLMAPLEQTVDSAAVLDLVHQSHCMAYDCEFVAAAMQLNTRLITMDRKLVKAFPGVATFFARSGR